MRGDPIRNQRVLSAVVPAQMGGNARRAARSAVELVALKRDLEVGELVESVKQKAHDGEQLVVFTWAVRKRKRTILEWNRDPKKVRRFES
ncbi:MAG TPA: hypothetical protein VFV01_47695 [Spirillospora sp.]|nr:hypothetical protein [Spirillospora sp.]